MAKVPAYATYLYNHCIARRESPDPEFEGCDEILVYLLVRDSQGAVVKITELVQSLMFGTGPTVHRKVTLLESRGLIKVSPNKADARAKDLLLAPAGLSHLKKQTKLMQQWIEDIE